MGRRKTNIKKKIAARRQKNAIHAAQYYRNQIFKKCIDDVMNMLRDEAKKQEAYRWN